jgi:hypothetical protein
MDIYWDIFTMHGPMNVKFPNNTSKRQMEFNSAFIGLTLLNITYPYRISNLRPLREPSVFPTCNNCQPLVLIENSEVLKQFRDMICLRKYLRRRVVSWDTLTSGEVRNHSNGWWQQPTSSDPQRSHSACSKMAQSPSFLLLLIILFIYKLLMSFVTTVIKECRRHCDGNGLRKP